MSELPKMKQSPEHRKVLLAQLNEIATEFIKRKEVFPFPGINQADYNKCKQEEQDLLDLGIGIDDFDPIDVALEKFRSQGIEIRMSNNKKDIYIIPAGSRDNKSSTLPLRYLDIKNEMNLLLKKLIELDNLLKLN